MATRREAVVESPARTGGYLACVLRHLRPRRDDRILEIGCGCGFLTRRLQALAPETHGVDPDPAEVACAVTGKLRVMTALALGYPDGYFDKLCALQGIGRERDLAPALLEMARVVRPGGQLLIAASAAPLRSAMSEAPLEHLYDEFSLQLRPQFVTLVRRW